MEPTGNDRLWQSAVSFAAQRHNSDAERQKFVEKTKRAIRCAGDDPEMQQAVRIPRSLVGC